MDNACEVSNILGHIIFNEKQFQLCFKNISSHRDTSCSCSRQSQINKKLTEKAISSKQTDI